MVFTCWTRLSLSETNTQLSRHQPIWTTRNGPMKWINIFKQQHHSLIHQQQQNNSCRISLNRTIRSSHLCWSLYHWSNNEKPIEIFDIAFFSIEVFLHWDCTIYTYLDWWCCCSSSMYLHFLSVLFIRILYSWINMNASIFNKIIPFPNDIQVEAHGAAEYDTSLK